MAETAIKFENISKQYHLGKIGTGTISHDFNRWWVTTIRGKEDPYLKIGQVNDRASKAEGEYVWALKDIDFEVKQGEVLGIIGKNGAGKSTLLKILSRVTTPTTGRITASGRIASLLEVGTGFHPEMTGRENIYMNGAIMGMTKDEIVRKFDEIIDFSGVEKYIDTPVKRYSSGMTVRLGFAIAAHLEPEILVVDEVLAVGDAEFQKKAIGKMQEVSKGEGRTVLFVSHNMGAVRNLCTRGIVLMNGGIVYNGSANGSIDFYLNERTQKPQQQIENPIATFRGKWIPQYAEITEIAFSDSSNKNIFTTSETISFYLGAKGLIGKQKVRVAGSIYTIENYRVGLFFSSEYFIVDEKLQVRINIELTNHNLALGEYYMSISIGSGDHTTGNVEFDILTEVLFFEIRSGSSNSSYVKWEPSWGQILFPVTTYSVK